MTMELIKRELEHVRRQVTDIIWIASSVNRYTVPVEGGGIYIFI